MLFSYFIPKMLEEEGLYDDVDKQVLIRTSYTSPWAMEARREEVMVRRKEKGEKKWRSPFDK